VLGRLVDRGGSARAAGADGSLGGQRRASAWHAFAAHVHVQTKPQLGVPTRGAIGPTAAGMDLADLERERLVSRRPLRQRPARPGGLARACHTQHAGKTGDSVVGFLRIDQPIATHR
jgi:hypothetical protein